MADEKKSPECTGEDLISLGPQLPDGNVLCIRHKGDHTVEGGMLRILSEDGGDAPAGAEVVHLKRREGNTYEVTESSKEGPAMVNSSAYRTGWESIFGGKQTVGQA